MYELKKNRKAYTSKFAGTWPSFYKKRIYGAAVSQRLRNTALADLTAVCKKYKHKRWKHIPR